VIADFRDLLAALNASGVRFLVVGAHALAAQGIPRATGDLDVWVEASAENARRVWSALAMFGAPLQTLTVRESDFARPDLVIQLGLPPYRIDLLTSISGVSFPEAWEGRLYGTLFDVPVTFIGRTEFVRNKRATARPRDLEDLRSLGESV
jgi:hypothetical protein